MKQPISKVSAKLTHHLNTIHILLVRMVSARHDERPTLVTLVREEIAELRNSLVCTGLPTTHPIDLLDTVYLHTASLGKVRGGKINLGTISLCIRGMNEVRNQLERLGFDLPAPSEIQKRSMADRPEWKRVPNQKSAAA